MSKCKNCPYSFGGERDSLSDWCDSCTHDPDTGWGGFTDNSIGEHFMNETEQKQHYEKYSSNDELKYIMHNEF